jgi:methionyl-tRNA formyltransferase
MLSKRMREIDWGKPSADIVRLIHGLNPWPGARTGGLKLLNARITKTGGGQPGEVLTADAAKGLVIGAGEGAVEIVRLQAPGGKPMDAGVYLLGHPMQAGGLIHAATE